MNEAALLEAEAVVKEYRTDTVVTRAVSEVSLRIAPGEYLVLAGPSGCGKSSLLSTLGLLEPPTAGSVRFEGKDTGSMTEADRARLRGLKMGFVFQSFQLIPYLSVLDNIRYPLQFYRGMSAVEQKEAAARVAGELGLEARLEHFPDQLSGGQQQRVAIGRALVGQPRLLLADEPTGNLDSESGDRIMELLRNANAAGTAICLVTHDERYMRQGDRTLRMSDGRIVEELARQPEGATAA